MSEKQVDWQRTQKALGQIARRRNVTEVKLMSVVQILPDVVRNCGAFSQSRVSVLKIGAALLSERGRVLVPVCPDYTHVDGRYTFQGLNGGVSLLAERHISFLEQLKHLLGDVAVVFLIADHEADDKELCRATRTSASEFRQLVMSSQQATAERVKAHGWGVELMTTVIHDLVEREQQISAWLAGNPAFNQRIVSETIARRAMYSRINPALSSTEQVARTIKTAAQYIALGEYAALHGYLICNHTTTNLSWYLQTQAAVLHNPITVY